VHYAASCALALGKANVVLTSKTAQVAAQQGKYLGGKFTKLAKQHKVLQANFLPGDDDEAYYKPFRYLHLGSLAYIGNS
jgi:NADH dehydrogenase FAD-containing subunit